MLTYKELTGMPEWVLIAEKLGELFAEHSARAISEEKDIAVVRYHKGWVDAINTFIEMPEILFPLAHEEESIDDDRVPGESIIVTRRDGSIY